MFGDLIRALLAAAVAGVLPGYFWAVVLSPRGDVAERLTWSSVLSVASVPVVALVLAKLAGTGVTLWVAVGSVAIVAGSGAVALAVRGPARAPSRPVLPRPPAIRDPGTLALVGIAFAAALAVVLIALQHRRVPGWLLIVVAVLLVVAGVVAAWHARPATDPPGPAANYLPAPPVDYPPAAADNDSARPAENETARPAENEPARPAEEPGSRVHPAWRAAALAVTLALIAVRGYAGAIRLDWPFLRGSDQFSYVIMSEQMMRHGSYGTFLTYPPGFSTLSAVVCRLSGLTPLALFPVLAPALLLLTGLGAYALATRLWGWPYGIAATALSGLVLTGAYTGFGQGRYPDLISAFFLMVMLVAALAVLYQRPSLRAGALVTVVGASVVFYHPVVSIYLALLLALVALGGLPYLLLQRRRRDAGVLLSTLVAVALLSACYAAYIYNLGGVISGSSSTSDSVSIVVGSQAVPPASHLLTELGPALVWLGLFGLAALVAAARFFRAPPQVLAAGTVLAWCVLMYAGSRTSLDGFPTRFERDLGAPLAVTAAFGAGLILRSLLQLRASRKAVLATAAAVAAVVTVMAVVPAVASLLTDSRARGNIISAPVAAAGQWLRQHNTGGTIITTRYMNPSISNRAVLAMGGYAGLQSYSRERTEHPRSLPPAGRQPLLDSYQVLDHPESCASARALTREDVRYVVLYKPGWRKAVVAFHRDPARYHPVFENPRVIIFAVQHGP
ncbi:MAG TPA: hypothetical protein VH641_01170, partial [Streptosporangiaceae bacterium]